MGHPVLAGDVRGKTIVITGASAGIGAAAARRLSKAGATVVAVGRSQERTAAVAADLGTEPVIADFASFAQVRRAAEVLLDRCPRIHVLANNAGGIVPSRTLSDDGHELTFQSNHLAGFLLTRLLLPRLRETANDADVRIITTSSLGNRFAKIRVDDLEWEHRRYGNGWIVYSATKLMNIMFTRHLAQEVANDGIAAVCFHPEPGRNAEPVDKSDPDRVRTNFAEDTRVMRLFHAIPGLSNRQLSGAHGAQPLVWLSSTPELIGSSGAYFDGMIATEKFNKQAKDDAIVRQLWDRSLELVRGSL
ncbi:MAG TPA: SDR family NAD(P)-dependent oxidoreductase [Streptosporangiaceae bacterium]|jgi:NAD(P)-dependent dehydrogenase (short-subunit alcohol dehydrogenase family)